jgi:hypothetical protein
MFTGSQVCACPEFTYCSFPIVDAFAFLNEDTPYKISGFRGEFHSRSSKISEQTHYTVMYKLRTPPLKISTYLCAVLNSQFTRNSIV